jgi:hypothetical protein
LQPLLRKLDRSEVRVVVSKWILVILLGLQVHFAASYLVPLDKPSQAEFGGLLRWFWPWAYGDGGLLGQITSTAGFPMPGFFLAMTTAGVLLLATLAVAGIWIPVTWWRALAMVGAALLVCLMVVFFGPTKLIPMAFAVATLYVAMSKPPMFATG